MHFKFLKLLVLFVCTSFYVQSQNNSDISFNSKWEELCRFGRSPDSQAAEIWGVGKQYNGVYPNEKLSSFFIRKLSFDTLQFNEGKLNWIFTGKLGKVMVSIDADSIWLTQRYYDSFGLHGEQKVIDDKISRYPESIWLKQSVPLSENVNEVVVSMNHTLQLELFVNGSKILQQECQIDFDRHQLTFLGEKGIFTGHIEALRSVHAIVTVDEKTEKQTMLGFGAITSVMAYNELSNEGQNLWWKYIRDYNLLIHREYPIGQLLKPDFSNWDLEEDAVIHYYGDNFPNGEISDFRYNKKMQSLGGMIIFEFWKLPDWMYVIKKGADGKEVKVLDVESYASAIVNYCHTAKQKTGEAPAIVGIQNEVTQSKEDWQDMTLTLRKKLDENGFSSVKIHSHNSSYLDGGILAMKAFKAFPEVWDNIDYTATNMYDYQNFFTKPDSFDIKMKAWKSIVQSKPFISTELCVNDSRYQNLSYRIAFLMGELYHKNMTLMDATSIIYCWGLLNGPQPSFDGTRSLFRVNQYNHFIPEPSSFQLRVFGSFSRNVFAGMQRIEVQSTHTDLLVSAFKDKKRKTLVMLNRSNQTISVELSWDKAQFKSAEITDQFNENRRVEIKSIKQKEKYIIQPGQILTLIQN